MNDKGQLVYQQRNLDRS